LTGAVLGGKNHFSTGLLKCTTHNSNGAITHASSEYVGTMTANSTIGHLKPIRTKLNIDYQQIN